MNREVLLYNTTAIVAIVHIELTKEEQSDPGFVEKLVTQIIKNIQVEGFFSSSTRFTIFQHIPDHCEEYSSVL